MPGWRRLINPSGNKEAISNGKVTQRYDDPSEYLTIYVDILTLAGLFFSVSLFPPRLLIRVE
jgi:hypothetical protein